jgi:hypothetical protein
MDPTGRVLLWSRPSKEATLVTPPTQYFYQKNKNKKASKEPLK